MNIDIKKNEQGIIIEGVLLFTYGENQSDYINLKDRIGQNMNYGLTDPFRIEFPGEYDKNGIFFKVYEGDEGKLNYIIKIEDKRIALIQTPGIIEKESFDSIDFWLYTNDYTTVLLDKLELDGKRINLNETLENHESKSEGQEEQNSIPVE